MGKLEASKFQINPENSHPYLLDLILYPSQQYFSYLGMGPTGLNQY